MRNWLIQIKKGYLDLCILSLIHRCEQVYGLGIIEKLTLHGIQLKEGTLYPLLSRMTKDGTLTSFWQTEKDSSHPRKYYRLTEKGVASLKEMEREYFDMFDVFNEIRKGQK